jgi:glycosyltransferase involved in cell wall biosynthesis
MGERPAQDLGCLIGGITLAHDYPAQLRDLDVQQLDRLSQTLVGRGWFRWHERRDYTRAVAGQGVRYLSYPPGSGYGEAAEEYMTALRAAGVSVSWTPLQWGTGAWGPLHELAPFTGSSYGPYRHNDICNVSIDSDTLVVHSPPLWYEPWSEAPERERRIAYTTYETDRLPAEQVGILNHYDLVLVPSTHNRDVFRSSGVQPPIHVVPHISRPPRAIRGGQFGQLEDGLFVFYVISTWTARKALPETILAYLDAFTAEDPVALVVKTTVEDHVALERIRRGQPADPSPHLGLAWWSLAQLLRGRRSPPRIHLVAGDVARPVIDELHTRGGCFVSLSRGEGWNLGAFDAAAHGNPVVVTGWGGHLDFLPPDFPYLVDYELVPAADDDPDDWFHPASTERWARADVAHASSVLRRIYEHQDEGGAWGAELQRFVAEKFSQAAIASQLMSAVHEVAGG